jgi:hypothetical protein
MRQIEVDRFEVVNLDPTQLDFAVTHVIALAA